MSLVKNIEDIIHQSVCKHIKFPIEPGAILNWDTNYDEACNVEVSIPEGNFVQAIHLSSLRLFVLIIVPQKMEKSCL